MSASAGLLARTAGLAVEFTLKTLTFESILPRIPRLRYPRHWASAVLDAGRIPFGQNKRPAPQDGTGLPTRDISCLGLLFLHVDLQVDSRRHLLQLFEAGLGLLSIRAVGIQLDSFLISLDGSGSKLRHFFIANLLERHSVDQRSTQQVPGLRVLGIQLRRLF